MVCIMAREKGEYSEVVLVSGLELPGVGDLSWLSVCSQWGYWGMLGVVVRATG